MVENVIQIKSGIMIKSQKTLSVKKLYLEY